jgi:hypothetical protein
MYRIIFFAVLCYVFGTGNLFALGSRQSEPESVNTELNALQAGQRGQANNPNRAEQVMRALGEAYPRQIDRVEFRNGDWALLLRGTWYYFADGRLLPESQLANVAQFSPQPFYNYQRDLPVWRRPSPEDAARFSSLASTRSANPPRRSTHFFDDLWRINNRDEAYQRVKTLRFLGRPVMVHYLILEVLALVEEEILTAARSNPQLQTWVNSISSVEGWYWRNIADTQSRSFHSYGLALDLMPRSLGGRETYWLWASQRRADWWNISYNERYHPPIEVIRAFEKYGFVWGGKWLFFDTMHFEYRPEVLILAGMPPETRR